MKIFFLHTLFGCCLFITTNAQQAGDIDFSFGLKGRVIDSAYMFSTSSVAVQSDGKILQALTLPQNGKSVLKRYTTNGAPDASFGINGVLEYTNILTGFINIIVQPNDKILALAGGLVIRFLPDGTFDNSFGVNGVTNVPSIASVFFIDIILQNDGKILVSYNDDFEEGPIFPYLVRFTENGILDTVFGENGVVNNIKRSSKIGLQQDGKIILAGNDYTSNSSFRNTFAFYRLNTDGSHDNSFGNNGTTLFTFPDAPLSCHINSIVIQSTGKIVAAGYEGTGFEPTPRKYVILRLTKNGKLDSSFYRNGITPLPFNTVRFAEAYKILLLPNDDLLLGGQGNNLDGNKYTYRSALVKLNKNGYPDNSFGSFGHKLYLSDSGYFTQNLALQPDGKIIGAGNNNITDNFCVARYFGLDKNIQTATAEKINNAQEVNINNIKVYPNPAHQQIIVSGLPVNSRIFISDNRGKIVKQFSYQTGTPVDISSLIAGKYFLIFIENKHHKQVASFIKY